MNLEPYYHDALDALTLAAILPYVPGGEILHVTREVTSKRTKTGTAVIAEVYFHIECVRRAEHDGSVEWTKNKQRLSGLLARGDGVFLRPHAYGSNEYCSLCLYQLSDTPVYFRKPVKTF